jgi:ribonuclease-3
VRAAVVSTHGLAPIAGALGIGPALLLGRGEESSGGREKGSILVDALEALIGAIYLSAGYDGAQKFVSGLLVDEIAGVAASARLGDPKNQLQELSAHLGHGAPSYVVSEQGPDHAKQFTAEAVILDRRVGAGEGRSKKEAERQAAEGALAALGACAGRLDDFPLAARTTAPHRRA